MVRTVLALEPMWWVRHSLAQDERSGCACADLSRAHRAAVAVTADRDQDLVRRALEEHVLAFLVKRWMKSSWVRRCWWPGTFRRTACPDRRERFLEASLAEPQGHRESEGDPHETHHWSEAEAFRRLQRAAMNNRTP